MAVKVSQLPELSAVDDATLFSVVDTANLLLVSKKVTALHVADFILAGNAASATKLETPRLINGVAFDGTQDINISVAVRQVHGFSMDNDGNLIYSITQDPTIEFQNELGDDLYKQTDIGTDEYEYSLDGAGNLIVTFTS